MTASDLFGVLLATAEAPIFVVPAALRPLRRQRLLVDGGMHS